MTFRRSSRWTPSADDSMKEVDLTRPSTGWHPETAYGFLLVVVLVLVLFSLPLAAQEVKQLKKQFGSNPEKALYGWNPRESFRVSTFFFSTPRFGRAL